jgi:hypothetical protein
MKTETETNKLAEFLADKRTLEFFGPGFALKADILASMIRGDGRGCLTRIAKLHSVTRSAASAQARRAQAIFGKTDLPS